MSVRRAVIPMVMHFQARLHLQIRNTVCALLPSSRDAHAHEITDPADEDKRAFIWRLLLAKVFFSLKPCERHRIVLLQ
jgi:hypothetical protein